MRDGQIQTPGSPGADRRHRRRLGTGRAQLWRCADRRPAGGDRRRQPDPRRQHARHHPCGRTGARRPAPVLAAPGRRVRIDLDRPASFVSQTAAHIAWSLGIGIALAGTPCSSSCATSASCSSRCFRSRSHASHVDDAEGTRLHPEHDDARRTCGGARADHRRCGHRRQGHAFRPGRDTGR